MELSLTRSLSGPFIDLLMIWTIFEQSISIPILLHFDNLVIRQEKSLQLQRKNTTTADVSGTGNSPSSSSGEWKFELRVRYLPTDLTDLYDRDKVTFSCYYDQVSIIEC